MRLVLTVVAGVIALLCLGGLGVGVTLYDTATAINREDPDVVVSSYLRAEMLDRDDAKAARAEMGVVPQLDNLDVDVTVEENLAVYARLYRVDDVWAAVDRALDLARLQGRRHDAVDQLSGGMRRRLLLARGLVHEPRLVLLPISRRKELFLNDPVETSEQ